MEDGGWESILHAKYEVTEDLNAASWDMCPGSLPTEMFVVVQDMYLVSSCCVREVRLFHLVQTS